MEEELLPEVREVIVILVKIATYIRKTKIIFSWSKIKNLTKRFCRRGSTTEIKNPSRPRKNLTIRELYNRFNKHWHLNTSIRKLSLKIQSK